MLQVASIKDSHGLRKGVPLPFTSSPRKMVKKTVLYPSPWVEARENLPKEITMPNVPNARVGSELTLLIGSTSSTEKFLKKKTN